MKKNIKRIKYVDIILKSDALEKPRIRYANVTQWHMEKEVFYVHIADGEQFKDQVVFYHLSNVLSICCWEGPPRKDSDIEKGLFKN